MIRNPYVKICCIGSLQEAWMAIDAGASAMGLVSLMPSGPGVTNDDLIAEDVREAVENVEPSGLDLCNGERTHGKLDRNKLEDFFNALDH